MAKAIEVSATGVPIGGVVCEEDRKPSVTLFLLHCLERNVPDPALKKETAALEAFIKAQTAAKPRTTP